MKTYLQILFTKISVLQLLDEIYNLVLRLFTLTSAFAPHLQQLHHILFVIKDEKDPNPKSTYQHDLHSYEALIELRTSQVQ